MPSKYEALRQELKAGIYIGKNLTEDQKATLLDQEFAMAVVELLHPELENQWQWRHGGNLTWSEEVIEKNPKARPNGSSVVGARHKA